MQTLELQKRSSTFEIRCECKFENGWWANFVCFCSFGLFLNTNLISLELKESRSQKNRLRDPNPIQFGICRSLHSGTWSQDSPGTPSRSKMEESGLHVEFQSHWLVGIPLGCHSNATRLCVVDSGHARIQSGRSFPEADSFEIRFIRNLHFRQSWSNELAGRPFEPLGPKIGLGSQKPECQPDTGHCKVLHCSRNCGPQYQFLSWPKRINNIQCWTTNKWPIWALECPCLLFYCL